MSTSVAEHLDMAGGDSPVARPRGCRPRGDMSPDTGPGVAVQCTPCDARAPSWRRPHALEPAPPAGTGPFVAARPPLRAVVLPSRPNGARARPQRGRVGSGPTA